MPQRIFTLQQHGLSEKWRTLQGKVAAANGAAGAPRGFLQAVVESLDAEEVGCSHTGIPTWIRGWVEIALGRTVITVVAEQGVPHITAWSAWLLAAKEGGRIKEFRFLPPDEANAHNCLLKNPIGEAPKIWFIGPYVREA